MAAPPLIIDVGKSSAVQLTIGVFVSVFTSLVLMNLFSGIPLLGAVQIAAIVAAQAFIGSALLLLAPSRNTNRIEFLGLSLVLGTLVSTFAMFLLSGLFSLGTILAFLILSCCAVVIFRSRMTVTLQGTRKISVIALSIVMLLGMFVESYFWRENPLSWLGWWQHYSDIYFHEGIAKSITENGLDNLNWLSGFGIGYHWFGDAWIGYLDALSGAEHFTISSRVVISVSILAIGCLAWSWASKLSRHSLAPLLASLFVLVAVMLGAGLRNSYSIVGALYSPTHSFALMSLLALSLVTLYQTSHRFRFAHLALICVLGIGAGGGRITQIVVLLGATMALLIHLTIAKRLDLSWIAKLLAMWLGVIIGLIWAIRPWATIIRNNKFLLEPNTQFGAMLGFVPDNSTLGNLASVIAVLFSVGAGWAGLLWYLRSRPIPDSIAWILGGSVAGFLAVFLTYQNGFSHMTFLWSASALALVGSGVGVAEAVHRAHETTPSALFWRASAASIVLGVVMGGLGVWISFESPGLRFEGLIRWSIPILIWLVALALGLSLAIGFRISLRSPMVWAVAILVLTSAAVSAGLTAATVKLFQPLPAYTSSTPLALTQSQLDAADWVEANVPDSGLFVTNRFCMDPKQSPPGCKSNWFLVSALAGRPTLVEGYSDGTGMDISTETPENTWLRERVLPIIDFSSEPSSVTQKELWNQNVRWVWIDRTITTRDSWEPFATKIFENETTEILKMNPPTN